MSSIFSVCWISMKKWSRWKIEKQKIGNFLFLFLLCFYRYNFAMNVFICLCDSMENKKRYINLTSSNRNAKFFFHIEVKIDIVLWTHNIALIFDCITQRKFNKQLKFQRKILATDDSQEMKILMRKLMAWSQL